MLITTSAMLCLVIAVHDGDTLRAQCEAPFATQGGQPSTINVRLAEIDAPEMAQPWGRASRDALRVMCLHKPATVAPVTLDRFGRTVAHVSCKGVDASRRQVERGMAWVYVKYAPAGTPLLALQASAQHHRRGLWRDGDAINPGQWRHPGK